MSVRNLNNTIESEKLNFIENQFKGRCYIASKVLTNIYPTLFGEKPATVIRMCNFKQKKLMDLWDQHRNELQPPEVKTFELKRTDGSVTVLFYKPESLLKTLYLTRNLRFLGRFGYSPQMDLDDMLRHLKERFTDSFPHEIGIFLGIPLKDVLGYLGLISLPCSLCGYWKVYGRKEDAKNLFENFRMTKEILLDLILGGEKPTDILKNPNRYCPLFKKPREVDLEVS